MFIVWHVSNYVLNDMQVIIVNITIVLMKKQGVILSYKIRPSARLISTIGKDLVKDKFAAVAELVKNSYDADATYSYVCIDYEKDK